MFADAQCESTLIDGFFVAADDSAHVVYSCLTGEGSTSASGRRYASFSLEQASSRNGGSSSVTPLYVQATPVKLTGYPSWVTYDPKTGITLVAGYCEAQEIQSGTAGKISSYCGSRYALREVGLKIFSLADQAVGMMASPRSPDGIDTQVHFLRYRDGAWSAPRVVTTERVLSTGLFAFGSRKRRAFLVTHEGPTVGRWIDY